MCSIVGFTSMSKEVPPDAVMGFLNELFTLFDELVDAHQIYKVTVCCVYQHLPHCRAC